MKTILALFLFVALANGAETSLTFYPGPIPGGSGLQGNLHVKSTANALPIGTTLGVYDGCRVTQLWDVAALDYENEDCVLAYTHNFEAPFYTSGDMLRISRNRRWFFGPSVGSPKNSTATFTMIANPDTPSAMEFRPWYYATPYDVKLTKWSNSPDDGAWVTFARAGDTHCFRIGMTGTGYAGDPWSLCIYANGTGPDNPGKLIMRLTENGDLTISGKLQ